MKYNIWRANTPKLVQLYNREFRDPGMFWFLAAVAFLITLFGSLISSVMYGVNGNFGWGLGCWFALFGPSSLALSPYIVMEPVRLYFREHTVKNSYFLEIHDRFRKLPKHYQAEIYPVYKRALEESKTDASYRTPADRLLREMVNEVEEFLKETKQPEPDPVLEDGERFVEVMREMRRDAHRQRKNSA